MRTDNRRTAAVALAVDLLCVVAFCTLGRRSHAEGLTVSGVAETAWPFLVGAAAGWVAARGWRRPLSLTPTGVAVWVATVVIGMVLRKVTGAGTAASFIVVASLTTALLLLGWRALALLAARRTAARG
jgi:peptidoglycan/LPS O-acetylase OafA/YrhL